MGQTKRIRKKYETPIHPWQKERIIEEKEYIRNYGFKNKKEIWKEIAKLRKARAQAKKLIADKFSEQARKEEKELLVKLVRYGLLTKDSKLEDVLGLKAIDFFDRRLQTFVIKKGFARSTKQARQFIVHGHVIVNEKKVTAPSYMVSLAEEPKIIFDALSTLSKEDHPERAVLTKEDKKVLEEIKGPKKEEVKKITEESKIEKAVKEETKSTEVASE
ncbi:30S ribosomal protein S4 [archaeon]|nr:30S ribosomal protein S4 [archaeon]